MNTFHIGPGCARWPTGYNIAKSTSDGAQRHGDLARGAVTLTVTVAISYTDETQRSYCYRMNFLYNAATGNFDANGGSDRCGKGVAGEG